jgi:hypothetical protein
MKRQLLPFLVCCLLLCSFSAAQMSTLPAAQAIAGLRGPPKNPPILSQMTVIMQGGLDYQDTINLKGRVASVEREDIRQPIQNPNAPRTTTTLKFDDSSHLVERVNEVSNCRTTVTLVWEGGRLQKQTAVHHCDHSKFPDRSDFNEWSYSKNGRLSGFQSGSDKVAYTDLVNFKYDARGRLLGYELLARDVIEISYAGNRVTQSTFHKGQHQKVYEEIQIVDAKGQVMDLRVSDMTGGKLTLWYHAAFKYDEKGRVIEQQTDPFKLGSGDDYSPYPGKLTVEYDDDKQSGEQKFYDTDGKLVLHTKFEYDHDGLLTKLRVVDSSGKDIVGGETFTDAQYKSSTRPGSVEWEVIYDEHGNWTERRRWFTPTDGSPRIMTRTIRQNITYR